jgi:hypothetical protein
MHKEFVEHTIVVTKNDPNCIGLAVGGSWINNQIDEFSDIDFVLITKELISNDYNKMLGYAKSIGELINVFTGEHVGEKRLLVCMYDNPFLHVDIKFVTLDELKHRVENPVVLWDRDGSVQDTIDNSAPSWPRLDYQWIEDRFWTWIHYTALKIGRGEYFEAIDSLSFMRVTVLSPLMQIKNFQLPRGLRKIEQNFPEEDLRKLTETVPAYTKESILTCLEKSFLLYQELRKLFHDKISFCTKAEEKSIEYFYEIKKRVLIP